MELLILRGSDVALCFHGWDGYWKSPKQIGSDGCWDYEVHPLAIGPGEFILVQYEIGALGGGYTGLKSVSAHILELKEPAELTVISADEILHRRGAGTALSKLQGQQVIAFIKDLNAPWAWDNARAEVRAILTGEEPTAKERASDLVRQALAQGWNDDDPSTFEAPSAFLQQAIALYPGVAEARVFLGKMAIMGGRVEQAVAYFTGELSEASKPAALNAHSYLSIIYRALGREGEARQHAEAGTRTPEYRQMPTQLSPEVVTKVSAAVCRNRAEKESATTGRSTNAAAPAAEQSSDKKWWQVWK